MKGIGWRIGNGLSVKVWGDSWISGLRDDRLQSEVENDLEQNMRVSDLIRDGAWDLSGIRDRLTEEERKRMLKIWLTKEDVADKLIWRHTENGTYTVKSGYYIACREVGSSGRSDPSTSYRIPNNLWKCIWCLKVPPKIQQFMWTVLSGGLVTKEALVRRRCGRDPFCPICGEEEETIEHLLLLCPWAQPCWFGCVLGLKVRREHVSSIQKWCSDLLTETLGSNEHGRALVAAICWWIWKGRCEWVFDGVKVEVERVLGRSASLVKGMWEVCTGNNNSLSVASS